MARILVVDDTYEVRAFLREFLESAGHEVGEADNGASGIRLAVTFAPDLVITDILMPGKEGLEMIQELRRLDPRPRVIAISGGSTTGKLDVLKLAMHLGADRTFWKPFDLDRLLAAVDEELRARTQEA